MIYQFKATLKGMKPPVWRRFQVDGTMTFYELHLLLQLLFDWKDCQLHNFHMRRSNGNKVDEEIGTADEDFALLHKIYNEFTENLDKWFIKEKDRAVYTYDFGADWEHEIVLEAIMPPNEDVYYPHCMKAMRLAPDEDMRNMEIEFTEEVHWRELTEEINEMLEESNFEIIKLVYEVEEPFSWDTLLHEANYLNKIKPWKVLSNRQIFVVADHKNQQFLYCSVRGACEQEFGLAVYVGHEGLKSLQQTFAGTMGDDVLMKQHSILLTFVDRKELEPKDLAFLKEHGHTFRGRRQWVQMRSFVPGSYPWTIDEEEGRLLLTAVRQTIRMVEEIECGLEISDYEGVDLFFARIPLVEEGGVAWQTTVIEILPPSADQQTGSSVYVSELDLKRMKKLKFLDLSLLFDVFMIKQPIQEKPGERPYFPFMVIAMEKQSGTVIHQQMIKYKHRIQDVQFAFMKTIMQLNGMPKEIVAKAEIAESLSPVTSLLSIKVQSKKNLPAIDEFRDYMNKMSH